jgi:hypothetical protein
MEGNLSEDFKLIFQQPAKGFTEIKGDAERNRSFKELAFIPGIIFDQCKFPGKVNSFTLFGDWGGVAPRSYFCKGYNSGLSERNLQSKNKRKIVLSSAFKFSSPMNFSESLSNRCF